MASTAPTAWANCHQPQAWKPKPAWSTPSAPPAALLEYSAPAAPDGCERRDLATVAAVVICGLFARRPTLGRNPTRDETRAGVCCATGRANGSPRRKFPRETSKEKQRQAKQKREYSRFTAWRGALYHRTAWRGALYHRTAPALILSPNFIQSAPLYSARLSTHCPTTSSIA